MINNGDLVAFLSFLTVVIEILIGVAQRVYGNFTGLVKDRARLENELKIMRLERDRLALEVEQLRLEIENLKQPRSLWYRIRKVVQHGHF